MSIINKQEENDSKKLLDESYDSLKSCSDHENSNDSLVDEPTFPNQNERDYNTIRTVESGRPKHERHEAMLSPDQYSTGNILEQIDNESHNMSSSNTRRIDAIQSPQVQISTIEEKSNNFKEVVRQYIEKWKALELELLTRDNTLNKFKEETHKMQNNMEQLKDELIRSEKENQHLRDLQSELDRKIYELNSENSKFKDKSMINDELVVELKNQLQTEKSFNLKVAENLAKQTQDATKAKNMETSRWSEITELNIKICNLEEIINSKNDKLAEMQNEKLEDMKRFKDLKEKYETQLRKSDELSDKYHEIERKNDEFSKKIIESIYSCFTLNLETKDLSNVDEELQGKEDYIKKLKEENTKIKDRADVFDIKNRELLKANWELSNTIEELERKLRETEADRDQILDEMDKREEEHERYGLETSERLAEYDLIKKQFETLEKIYWRKGSRDSNNESKRVRNIFYN